MSDQSIERIDTTENGNPVYENTGEGHIIAIPNEGEVYIPSVMAVDGTGLSELVTAVVEGLENNQVVFANVINPSLKNALDGFTEEKEYAEQYGEHVTVLRGEWNAE